MINFNLGGEEGNDINCHYVKEKQKLIYTRRKKPALEYTTKKLK